MMETWLGLPLNAAEHGAKIDQLIALVHLLMLVLFIGWIVFFGYTLLRFRRGRNPRADYVGVKTHASSYLEAGVAVVEVALLVGLSIPFWSWKVSAFPAESDAIRVRVIAQQFAWNIHYPGPDGVFGRTAINLVNETTNPIGLDRKGDPHAKDDIVMINQMHIPVNKPIIVDLTTKDVIHSFALNQLRVKQDTIPGMTIPIHFVATLTSEQIREQLARTLDLTKSPELTGLITLDDVKDSTGKVILRKGRGVRPADVETLLAANVNTVRVGPRIPTEISCAQLCGLGHYRMKGFLTIHESAGYAQWLQDEQDELDDLD